MKNIVKFEDFEINNENIFIPEAEGMPVLNGTSFPIKYPHNEFKPGTAVEVSIYAKDHAGKKGIIGPPTKMKDKTDHVYIEFDDDTSAYLPYTDISRI